VNVKRIFLPYYYCLDIIALQFNKLLVFLSYEVVVDAGGHFSGGLAHLQLLQGHLPHAYQLVDLVFSQLAAIKKGPLFPSQLYFLVHPVDEFSEEVDREEMVSEGHLDLFEVALLNER